MMLGPTLSSRITAVLAIVQGFGLSAFGSPLELIAQGLNNSLKQTDEWKRWQADNWKGWQTDEMHEEEQVLLPTNTRVHPLPSGAQNSWSDQVGSNYPNTVSLARMMWDMESAEEHGHLTLFVDKTMKLLDLKRVMMEIETSVMSKVSCTACKIGAGLLQHFIKTGKNEDEIMNSIFRFCVSLKIQSPRVCQGITLLMSNEVIYIFKQINMSAAQICSFVIGDVCGDIYNPLHEWEIVFPPVDKPPIKPPVLPLEGAPNFKVLHISDTHFDPYYQEGSNAECNEPLCCRITNGPPSTPAAAAGKWGDYRKCDTPKRTVDHMLKHISNSHQDIDYIIWTGDLPPHDVWNQTREENLKILDETVLQMLEFFPKIPIFPCLGNHESAPVNSFPPPFAPEENSVSWLYNELNEQWRRWLPIGTSHTIKRGAFYSVLVRPGFRILSVNTNYCNNKNWWLLINSTDPVNELQWLIYELQGAEMNGEKVHIIGHIPPGHSDCLKVWSRNYYQIINRYESTVTAQFFGHTHYDEFEIFYDAEELERALGIAYIGPSVSPYYNLNPGYRIYYVDGDHPLTTRIVIDHETYVMDLKEANLYDFPVWTKLYSPRQVFQMPSLLPKDWDALVDQMSKELGIFDIYYRFYHKNSAARPRCDDECRKRLLCDLRSGRSHDREKLCGKLYAKLDGTTKIGWRAWLYNGLSLSYVKNMWYRIYQV